VLVTQHTLIGNRLSVPGEIRKYCYINWYHFAFKG